MAACVVTYNLRKSRQIPRNGAVAGKADRRFLAVGEAAGNQHQDFDFAFTQRGRQSVAVRREWDRILGEFNCLVVIGQAADSRCHFALSSASRLAMSKSTQSEKNSAAASSLVCDRVMIKDGEGNDL